MKTGYCHAILQGLNWYKPTNFRGSLRCRIKEIQLSRLGVDVRLRTDRHDLCYKAEVHKSRLSGCPGVYML